MRYGINMTADINDEMMKKYPVILTPISVRQLNIKPERNPTKARFVNHELPILI
jgi:hypothetical protein